MNERQAEFHRLYQLAVSEAQAGREVEAELAFGRAAAFAPELWCDVATRLAKEGEEALALDHFKTALQLTAHAGIRSGIFNNLAIIYAKRGQLDEALQMLDESLKADPQSADALVNFGQVWKWKGNLDLADRYCARALAINPWHSEGQFLQALNVLDRGDYGRGFPLYECRWRSRTNGSRKVECDKPEWSGPGAKFNGQPVRRVFVYCEQGAGDIFLMLRYAPLLRAAGLWQHWAVKPGMGDVVAALVDSFSEDGSPPAEFDCHVASASLPFLFGTTLETIPPCGYLKLGEAEPMDYGQGFHLGIVWRGNTGQYNDRIRSTALANWQPVLDVVKEFPGVQLHSLQVDGADEALFYPQVRSYDRPKGWLETMQRLAGLDLILSVDTGVVHLAGAMGLPVWCALHCRPYFVFPVACAGTPWYPSVRLFKQGRAFEWHPVFQRMANELRIRLTQIHDPAPVALGLVSGIEV
jgi:Tfp pilus assembly protein PilF